MFIDRKFRKPRNWSNLELKKFGHLFTGSIVNVSAYKDEDKNGRKYHSDYFINAKDYTITNYKSEMLGYQGDIENEIFLDLEQQLNIELINKFDVVINHTVLAHTFHFFQAFSNLCELSKDFIILVVPFLIEQHTSYGDYWRFSPTAIDKLFKLNNADLIYLNYNDTKNESIYLFAIATKNRNTDLSKIIETTKGNKISAIYNTFVGTKVINNSLIFKIKNRYLNKLRLKLGK